jgi:hypothetical protein
MGNTAFFAAADPFAGSGNLPAGASADVTTGQLGTVGVSSSSGAAVYHPSHPFFWFGLFAAGTAALVGTSMHLKVGKAKESVSL